jgi:hypothetical protein
MPKKTQKKNAPQQIPTPEQVDECLKKELPKLDVLLPPHRCFFKVDAKLFEDPSGTFKMIIGYELRGATSDKETIGAVEQLRKKFKNKVTPQLLEGNAHILSILAGKIPLKCSHIPHMLRFCGNFSHQT